MKNNYLLCTAAALICNSVFGQSLCFDAALDFRYQTNQYCADVAAVDLDNDGNLDVITSSFSAPTCFFKGLGDGTFLPYQELAGAGGSDLEIADINQDGWVDAVRYSSGTLDVLYNNGNGDLVPSSNYYVSLVSSNNSEFSLGMVNNDNLLDVAINDYGDNKVFILINDGSASFTPFEINVIDSPQNIKLSDLNGDGLSDLVVASATSDQLAIYTNNGAGNYTEILVTIGTPITSGLANIETMDYNEDGTQDILVGSGTVMHVVQNLGGNTFELASSPFMGSYSYGATFGDWNGDGAKDIAWANGNTGGATVLLNNGNGTWPSQGNVFYSSKGNAEELNTGDFNGDGNLDLVIANGNGNHFACLLGNGSGAFGPQTLLCGYGSESLLINDFDGDLDLDIIATNSGGANPPALALSRNNGDGTFMDTEFLPSVPTASEAATSDLNLDGFADIVIHSALGFAILSGDGTGNFTEAALIPTNNISEGGDRTIVLGDFNGDGITDISGNRVAADNVNFLYGLGNMQFTAPETHSDGLSYARCILKSQLNNDVYDDLAVCSNSSDQVFVYWGSPNGMTGPTIFNTPGAPEGLASFDADEDGDNDLIVAAPNANLIYFIPSNNDQTFGAISNFNTPNGANANRMDAADINNDGHLDIACAFYQHDAVGVFFGNGDGTFAPAFSYDMDQGPNRAHCADFNNDGAMDFASLNSGIFNVTVVLNNSAYLTYDGDLAFCAGDSVLLQASEGYSYAWTNGATTQQISVNESGTYSCLIGNQAGTCSLITPEVIVEVYTGQTVTLVLDSNYYCVQSPAFFLTGGFPFGGQYTGEGIVAGSFDPSMAGPGVFQVTYSYEDPGSCTNGFATATIEVDICDLVQESMHTSIAAYPNPASGKLFVSISTPRQFYITNLVGKILKSGIAYPQTPIDVTDLASGPYLISIEDENESAKIFITE
jgi:FG-GAP-like repeat/Secretion system C-terminal sorting domain